MEKLTIHQVPLDIVEKDYRVSLCLYDGDDNEEAFNMLYDDADRRQELMTGELNLKSHGFSTTVDGEVCIFINLRSPQKGEDVLVHELFHAASKLSRIMDSEEFGARVYTMLYNSFLPIVKKVKKK